MTRMPSLALSMIFVVSAGTLKAQSTWPQFGGPQRQFHIGHRFDTRAIALQMQWSTELGFGKSSPVVDAESVFVTYRQERDDRDRKNYFEGVAALNRATGGIRWSNRYECSDRENQESFSGDPRSPQSTPAIVGNHLICIGFTGVISCYDKSTGELKWRKNLVEDFGGTAVQFGVASSPLVIGDELCVMAGGDQSGLVRLDPATGHVRWRVALGTASYASPLQLEVEHTRQIVAVSDAHVIGFDASDGTQLWRFPLVESGLTNVPSPLVLTGGRMLVAGQGIKGTKCLEITFDTANWRVTELWTNPQLQFFYCNWIQINERIVAGCNDKVLMTFDADTGEILSRSRGFANGNLLALKDQLLAVSGRGQLLLLDVTDRGLAKSFVAPVVSTRVWAPPTLVQDELFVRAGKHVFQFCFSANGDITNRLDDVELIKFGDASVDPIGLIVSEFEAKGIQAALTAYEKLRLDPDVDFDVAQRMELAELAQRQSMFEFAETILRHTVEQFPDSKPAQRRLDEFRDQKKDK